MALGIFALLGAIDRGLVMLPLIPVPPSVWRITLELFWVPCAVLAAARGRMLAATREDADGLERFAATLRYLTGRRSRPIRASYTRRLKRYTASGAKTAAMPAAQSSDQHHRLGHRAADHQAARGVGEDRSPG